MSFVALDAAPVQRVTGPMGAADNPASDRVVHDFFGEARTRQPGPQGFLVDFEGETTVGAHFHPVDQFQVFFGGPGSWYQRHPIDELMVHYADAYTTYGPFGTEGGLLRFFTLRPDHSTLTAYMPGSRDKLLRKGRRNVHVSLTEQAGRCPAPGDAAVHTALADGDGLSVHLVTLGPEARIALPTASTPRGEYRCVVSGAIVVDDTPYGPRSLGWYERDEAPATVESGPDGLALLVLRFPPDTTAHLAETAGSVR
ncbi:MAG TPA: hypothetical protein VK611_23360 [Acidimicrobiales bacterium]|nr:hypothetical protein [Acidimicrobiales bacterium]